MFNLLLHKRNEPVPEGEDIDAAKLNLVILNFKVTLLIIIALAIVSLIYVDYLLLGVLGFAGTISYLCLRWATSQQIVLAIFVSTLTYLTLILLTLFTIGTLLAMPATIFSMVLVNYYLIGYARLNFYLTAIVLLVGFVYLFLGAWLQIPPYQPQVLFNMALFGASSLYTVLVCQFFRVDALLISRRKEKSQALLEQVINLNPSIIYTKDLSGKITLINQAGADFIGMSVKEILGKREDEMGLTTPNLPPEVTFETLDQQVFKGETLHIPQVLITNRKGEGRIFESIKTPLTDPEGKIEGMMGIVMDITEKVNAASAIQKSETRYRQIFENNSVAIQECDLGPFYQELLKIKAQGVEDVGRYLLNHPNLLRQLMKKIWVLDINKALLELTESPDKHFFITQAHTFLTPSTFQGIYHGVNAMLSGKRRHEEEVIIVSRTGRRKSIKVAVNFPEDFTRQTVSFTYQDITTLKAQAHAMRMKNQIIDNLLHQFPALYYRFDKEFTITESVGAGLKNMDLEDGAMVGENILKIFKDNAGILEAHLKVLKEGFVSNESVLKNPKGTLSYFDTKIFFDKEEQNGIGLAVDITEAKYADLALRESEERFRKLFEFSPFGIAIRDIQTDQLIDANERLVEMLGYTRGELLSIPRQNLTAWEDIDSLNEQILSMDSGSTVNYVSEKQYLRKDGSVFWARINRSKVSINNRPCIIGFIEDIDHQTRAAKALQESEERFRKFFENNPLAIAIRKLDSEKIIEVNPSFSTLFGYTQNEIIGQNWEILTTPHGNRSLEGEYQKLISGDLSSFTTEKKYVTKGGESLWCTNTRSLIRMDDQTYILAQIKDISEQKKQESIIREAIEELNQKNQALEKYISSNMQLENFAYIASHDLREPLLTIISFSELLKKRAKNKLNDQESQFLNFIISATRNMDRLIHELLSYSRVNDKNHRAEKLDPEPLIHEIIDELQTLIQEHRAKLTIQQLPPWIYADQVQLRQLFQNLLINAIKFRRPEVPPQILIQGWEEEQYWTFSIRDNGIGIPASSYEKIFLLFKRLHNKKEYPGTGIGLALCKKVIEQHQGRIWVESVPGEGSTFFFSLKKELHRLSHPFEEIPYSESISK